MNIPRRFKLFGSSWEVKQPNRVVIDGEKCDGYCDASNSVILLRRNLRREIKEQTFCHELIHAILFSLEFNTLSNNEEFVELVAKALHQVMTTQEY